MTPRSTTAGGILARQYLAIALASFVVLGLAGCLEPPAGEGTFTPTSPVSLASATSTASPTQTDTPLAHFDLGGDIDPVSNPDTYTPAHFDLGGDIDPVSDAYLYTLAYLDLGGDFYHDVDAFPERDLFAGPVRNARRLLYTDSDGVSNQDTYRLFHADKDRGHRYSLTLVSKSYRIGDRGEGADHYAGRRLNRDCYCIRVAYQGRDSSGQSHEGRYFNRGANPKSGGVIAAALSPRKSR